MKTKKCSTCGTDKSLDAFHADLRARDKRMSSCRDCRKTPKPDVTFEDYIAKTCAKCGISKLHSDFWKRGRGRGGLNPRCITCEREYREAYYSAKKDM